MRWARVGVALVATGLVASAALGFAHTRAGRPLLALLGRGSTPRCPLGYGPARAEDRVAARARFAATHRGTSAARSTSAMGLTLGSTTRLEVEAAVRGHCERGRAHDLECAQVDLAGESLEALWLDFEADRLEALIAVRTVHDASAASAAFARAERTISASAGAPTGRQGEPTAAALGRGLLSQASVEYRFTDEYVLVRVTELAPDRFTLTEEHRLLSL